MAGLAGDGVLTTRVAYTPLQRAQKVKGRQEVLTKVQVARGRRAGVVVDGGLRRRTGRAR